MTFHSYPVVYLRLCCGASPQSATHSILQHLQLLQCKVYTMISTEKKNKRLRISSVKKDFYKPKNSFLSKVSIIAIKFSLEM